MASDSRQCPSLNIERWEQIPIVYTALCLHTTTLGMFFRLEFTSSGGHECSCGGNEHLLTKFILVTRLLT